MSDKKILAVVGMAGSGKSTAVDLLVQKYQMPYIYFGDITLQEMKNRGLEPGQDNEKKTRVALREQHGMGAYAKLSLPKINEHLETNNYVLLDGLYSWSEYTFLRQNTNVPLILLAVIAKRGVRYERLQNRPTRPLSAEESEKRDFAEIEQIEKGGPIALCDYYITNDGTLENFQTQLEQLTQELGIVVG
ncbi:AAA family ATPase [Candidatus Uabimicrobium amorphum]|uniref:Dephospho-CoA kinase n=1 Tax=Uabimicrobium amorphum TaxID=2596890 RepID=A0A5S9IU81_UABAM|nr:AAA family ATPase [Candidatus Uabimicrobium amorphum]BBM87716.1 dephospho-CoA kinase [Candidatus Uabimicrobium amorphum]